MIADMIDLLERDHEELDGVLGELFLALDHGDKDESFARLDLLTRVGIEEEFNSKFQNQRFSAQKRGRISAARSHPAKDPKSILPATCALTRRT